MKTVGVYKPLLSDWSSHFNYILRTSRKRCQHMLRLFYIYM